MYMGFGSKFGWVATPLTVVIILLALQITSRKSWRFWLGDIIPMTIECILLAMPLIVLSMLLSSSAPPQHEDSDRYADNSTSIQTGAVLECSSVVPAYSVEDNSEDSPEIVEEDGRWQELLANVVTGIGAGIYEELVFRLILIIVLMTVFQHVFRLGHGISIILAVCISSALFGAYHHIIYMGGRFVQSSPFNWPEFSFRTIAGIYFAILFAIRGFGITAGAHAYYDIIAIFMNAFFPQP
ncbi:MAG: CPBP family intramembrane metalloprotease [Phycisphaerae bacterium]|nr:CPBP family intramembrane metalloprotease [Phycisphaerae bacterium]